MPDTASASSRWPLPATPATTDDLARADRQRDVPDGEAAAIGSHAEVVDSERDVLAGRSVAIDAPRLVDLAADHERRQRPRRRPGGGHGADGSAAAQHRHAVGDREHLVQLVGDEDHGAPVGRHRTQRLEEGLRLLRRQHRGRLVHDQDAGVAVESLQDLDPLLLADRQLPDARAGVDVQAVALGETGDHGVDRPVANEERLALRRGGRRARRSPRP